MKIPTTPVLLASLSLASSSLAAPTREKPDCDSPTIGEKSPLLAQDAWGPALHLKSRGVGGQGRPWGSFPVKKRQEAPAPPQPSSPLPPASPSPSFASSSTPLLGATGAGAAVNPEQASAAAAGLLTPVTGTLKGVVGDTTGALKGLLGNTPLGPVVGTVGDIGNGLLDKVGEIGNGGLGLGPILKPVKDIAGGLPVVGPIAGGLVDTVGGLNLAQQPVNGLPVVGPIAGGLVDKVGGINLAQQPTNGLPIAGPLAGSVVDRLGGMNLGQQPSGAPTPNVSPQLNQFGQTDFPTAQMVEETIVGRLEDGRFVTNTGRIIGLASSAGSSFPASPNYPTMGFGGAAPVSAPAYGQVPENVLPSDLGKVIATLPPGLGQILQPIGGAEKYLQIGSRLIPLGAADASQLSQLGLDRLPVTPVGAGFGYPGINYLQDGATPEPVDGEGQEDEDESKEVKANPVTTWMNGGTATMMDDGNNGTFPDANGTFPSASDNSTMTGSGNNTMPLAVKSHIPTAQFEVQPLELAPPSMDSATNQTIAGKPHSIIKGDVDPWYEVEIDGGDTFKRIAAEMSGEEKNYYSGGERDPDTEDGMTSPDHSSMEHGHDKGSVMGSGIEIGGGRKTSIFDGDKGRVGWQEITGTPSSTTSEWQTRSPSATVTPRMSSAHPGPTQAAHDDAGTYAWSEDWGDWVSAGMGDTDLHAGWDDASAFASASVSSPHPSSSHMWAHASAGLS